MEVWMALLRSRVRVTIAGVADVSCPICVPSAVLCLLLVSLVFLFLLPFCSELSFYIFLFSFFVCFLGFLPYIIKVDFLFLLLNCTSWSLAFYFLFC